MSSSWNGLIHTCRRRMSDGMLVEPVGHLLVDVVERLEEARHPPTAVLDHAEARAREPFEHAVRDERGEGVEDVAVLLVEEHAEHGLVEALELVASGFPVGGVAVVAGVGVVHHHRDAGFLAAAPERVEVRQRPSSIDEPSGWGTGAGG